VKMYCSLFDCKEDKSEITRATSEVSLKLAGYYTVKSEIFDLFIVIFFRIG
jgi:hypothetical protein